MCAHIDLTHISAILEIPTPPRRDVLRMVRADGI